MSSSFDRQIRVEAHGCGSAAVKNRVKETRLMFPRETSEPVPIHSSTAQKKRGLYARPFLREPAPATYKATVPSVVPGLVQVRETHSSSLLRERLGPDRLAFARNVTFANPKSESWRVLA